MGLAEGLILGFIIGASALVSCDLEDRFRRFFLVRLRLAVGDRGRGGSGWGSKHVQQWKQL